MNKIVNDTNNLIDLAAARFPVGTKAWHPTYRLCHIIESNGNRRKIRAPKLGVVEMVWEYAYVHVNELQNLNRTMPKELLT